MERDPRAYDCHLRDHQRAARPGFLVSPRSVLRRARRRGLCQQLPDRSLDLEPERPGVVLARLSRLLGDVLRRVGPGASGRDSRAVRHMSMTSGIVSLLTPRALKLNRDKSARSDAPNSTLPPHLRAP